MMGEKPLHERTHRTVLESLKDGRYRGVRRRKGEGVARPPGYDEMIEERIRLLKERASRRLPLFEGTEDK